MDELDKDLTLQWYERLEEQLIDIMRLIPPTPENFTAYSPPIAGAGQNDISVQYNSVRLDTRLEPIPRDDSQLHRFPKIANL